MKWRRYPVADIIPTVCAYSPVVVYCSWKEGRLAWCFTPFSSDILCCDIGTCENWEVTSEEWHVWCGQCYAGARAGAGAGWPARTQCWALGLRRETVQTRIWHQYCTAALWRVINSNVTLNQAREAISLTHSGSGKVTTVPMTGTMDTITEDHVMSPVTHTQRSDVTEPESTGAGRCLLAGCRSPSLFCSMSHLFIEIVFWIKNED